MNRYLLVLCIFAATTHPTPTPGTTAFGRLLQKLAEEQEKKALEEFEQKLRAFPLHAAVLDGDCNAIDRLIKEGEDPNLHSYDTHLPPPLGLAIMYGDLGCFNRLIYSDADTQVGDGRLVTMALEVGQPQMLKRLLVTNDIKGYQLNGNYGLLGTAISTKSHQCLKVLLAHPGIDLNYESPLRYAIETNSFDAFKALLAAGANTEATEVLQATPLMWAALKGEKKYVKILLKSGANLEAKDKFGDTAADWARKRGNRAVLKLLGEPLPPEPQPVPPNPYAMILQ